MMPKPLPKNCKRDEQARGIYFEVELAGRIWRAFITFEAVDEIYKGVDPIKAVSTSSYISGLVADRIKAGDVDEPIHLNTAILVAKDLAASRRGNP